MQFRNFVTKALGSEARVRILLYLLKQEAPTSEREIGKLLDMSNVTVNKVMRDFQDINLVSSMRVGAAHIWRINDKSYAYFALTHLHELAMYPPLVHLKEAALAPALKGLKGVKRAFVFGSVVEGRESPGSDIDLFVMVDKPQDKKSVSEALSQLTDKCSELYGNSLAPIVMTENESELKKNKTLADNAKKGLQVV